MVTNQNGFTLTNMVVGLAIGAIVMAAFVSTVQMMTRGKKNQDVKAAASMFIDELQQATRRPQACKSNLANGINSLDLVNAVPVARDVQFGNVTAGTEIAKGVKISKMTIKPVSNSVVVPGLNKRSVSARMEVVIVNDATNPPTLLRSRFVPLQVVVDGSNLIDSCSELDSSAQVCKQLDGVWDSNAPAGLNCMPTDKCLYGGSYSQAPSGFDAAGNLLPGYINTFTHGQSCPAGYSAQQTGTVSVARKGSKYQVAVDTYANFTCVRCLAPVPDQSSLPPIIGVDLDPAGTADALAAENEGTQDYTNIDAIRQALGL